MGFHITHLAIRPPSNSSMKEALEFYHLSPRPQIEGKQQQKYI